MTPPANKIKVILAAFPIPFQILFVTPEVLLRDWKVKPLLKELPKIPIGKENLFQAFYQGLLLSRAKVQDVENRAFPLRFGLEYRLDLHPNFDIFQVNFSDSVDQTSLDPRNFY